MTNLAKPDWKQLESTVIGLDLFDSVFISSSAGERKPNLAFYRHIIHTIHANPCHTIFVDPSLENVATARSFGMSAVLYEGPDRLRKTLYSLCFDSVYRGQFFMRLNTGKHLSFTSTGHTIQENFSQMLILEATRDPSLVAYTKFNGLFNFFRARGELTTHNFPYDADSTSIGVTVCDNISPTTRDHVMDEILKLRNSDGIIQVYFDASRPRIDPVVCVNVLTLFHAYGRGDQLKDTFNWVEDVLVHRAYLNGTRYYEPAEAFLFFLSRLLSVSSVARMRLRKAYAQRCRERIGMKGDALALAMRIICCTLEGIDASLDLLTLREMQQVDGGWADGWFYKYGSTGILIANRGLTTALAIRAIELGEGRHSDIRAPSIGEERVQAGWMEWPKSNWAELFDKDAWKFKKDIQNTYGSVVKVSALFGDQQLYITDPLAITHIFQLDRPQYDTNAYHLLRSRLSFGCGLVGTTGTEHAKQRRLLAPFFATKYLRTLLPVFYPFAHEVCQAISFILASYFLSLGLHELCANIERRIKPGDGVMNMHRLMSIAALEYVGTGVGYRFDGLNESKPNEFHEAAKALNPLTFKLSTFRVFLPWMIKLGPAWFRRELIDWLPWPDARRIKEVIYKIDSISRDILATRRAALNDGSGFGKDILSAILKFNEEADEDEKIEDYEIISHITTTLFAGHETTAGVLSRILHQMALCPDAQAKLRKEVTEARATHGDLDFDRLIELEYLDAVCKETLRVSIVPHFKYTHDIIVSIVGYNRNKDVWGNDAEEWVPDRWLQPLPSSVVDAKLPAVFSHMMTFTLGPRACMYVRYNLIGYAYVDITVLFSGYKFAEMEMKLILSVLISKFEFTVSPKEEIFWAMGGSITPLVKGSGEIEPNLPLKVSVVASAP
ncbi:hypothetical protein EWM64_g4776 [Hericium alpestre]|uniref:Cytochrome P450 n=1 Tax=Hericium alpestre TaxID=135208 RepID=A0A4Y9ZYS3_9AGAM|nr:hypothetical protein EWM64_g4776 [Hericium alpestre]